MNQQEFEDYKKKVALNIDLFTLALYRRLEIISPHILIFNPDKEISPLAPETPDININALREIEKRLQQEFRNLCIVMFWNPPHFLSEKPYDDLQRRLHLADLEEQSINWTLKLDYPTDQDRD